MVRCVIVTGPKGAGKTRWLQGQLRALAAQSPAPRSMVVLAEEGRTRMESFVRDHPGITAQKLFLPCVCCPPAGLEDAIRALLASSGAEWLFLELPAVAAPAIVAEFDRAFGWPRSVVLVLNEAWAAARDGPDLPYFHSLLRAMADTVVTGAAGAGPAR